MYFWENISRFGNAPALLDANLGMHLTYRQLGDAVEKVAASLRNTNRGLALTPLNNTAVDIVRYLALLQAGHVPLIYGSRMPQEGIRRLLSVYKPRLTFGIATDMVEQGERKILDIGGRQQGYNVTTMGEELSLNPLLALVLSTSGSVGSSKLVRLSADNIGINAKQICDALGIEGSERAITSVPLSYVYGLSVLNSHLLAGAAIVLETRSIGDASFWHGLARARVTSLAGVPWTYQMMKSMSFDSKRYPTLETFTISGGKVDANTFQWINATLQERNVYFMYGQTEAAGRIAVLHPADRNSAPGAAGKVVAGGQLSCDPDGAITYRGPNVMLGYAQGFEDLSLGDTLNGTLQTNDIGYLDNAGNLFITGRKSRMAKLFGLRINLDDVQEFFAARALEVCVLSSEKDYLVVCHSGSPDRITPHLSDLKHAMGGLPASAFKFRRVSQIPRLENGKISYNKLLQ